MAERTYLYGYGPGPYGASTTRRTKAFIMSQSIYSKVSPELMRRLFGLADAVIDSGGDYGFGSGWRSSQQQLSLFLSRYTKVSSGGTYYNIAAPYQAYSGRYVHTSGAAAAPPGRSYHEGVTITGYALAIDMVGDHTKGNALAPSYGVKHFAFVNSEPWHYQPVETPNARSEYVSQFENPRQWPLPGTPTEPPILDEEMTIHNPVRILDTRISGKPGNEQTFDVAPHSLTPAGSSVILNLTALEAEQPTFFTLWNGDGNPPQASQVNLSPSDTSPKNGFTIVPLGADGRFTVFSLRPAHLIIDQIGFIAP